MNLAAKAVLDIIAQGAWNGGTVVDNSVFEQQGLRFKGGIPVTHKTIEERIGIRTRVAASPDERIGVRALEDLVETSDIDLSKVKLVIGATNVGEDLYDAGPLIKYPFDLLKADCPEALVLDLYAGCPGFNVSVELGFMLSLTGGLKTGDITIIVGAENIHRAKAFRPEDTANVIFGDDAIATALETKSHLKPKGQIRSEVIADFSVIEDYALEIAQPIASLNGSIQVDGIIIDNQLGKLECRVPALASRVQHRLVEIMHPEENEHRTFYRFKEALRFYDRHVRSFAYDMMTLYQNPMDVSNLAQAYVKSGRYKTIISVYLSRDGHAIISLHTGQKYPRFCPQSGIIDTLTQTHGCFANYIQAVSSDGELFGELDGKGVFLYATRGARNHLNRLFSKTRLSIDDIDLLVEHQANFAMILLTLEQVLSANHEDVKPAVAEFIANKMITNIHKRGNCSVVCMQRLPYDLQRDALSPDRIQGYVINGNLNQLKQSKTVLYDSVGAGMTRSSFLLKK
jgi:3-oxoacyl-[acyl-carrier-protein] synthase III